MAETTGSPAAAIPTGIPTGQVNITANETSQGPLSGWEALAQDRGLLFLEARIVFAALACIYCASHAALRRPPSAVLPKKAKDGDEPPAKDDDFVQGLMPSDAIMMPVLAGTVLVGLYYLIKWLEDPDIINKILQAYLSSMSLASIGKLLGDGLQLLTSLVFPTVWATTDGTVLHIDSAKKRHRYARELPAGSVDSPDESMNSPFPGRLSRLRVPGARLELLWEIRRLLRENWSVRIKLHGIVSETFKIQLNDIMGVVLAIATNLIYYQIRSTFLSNVMGIAFSYTGIVMLSPTTFATGSAVLFGLFFYDIYMVFYTPYMVTVATKLDVPIKLVFEGPKKSSMLGLGDIVVPGIFIGLCLRFDHFMHYYRQRKLVPVELTTEVTSTAATITSKETRRMVVKPEYADPQGRWGDRLWCGKIFSPDATPALRASSFPKPYFHASLVGYFLAMVFTMAMLLVFNHAQPALLYLVPGVVLATWVTGALRGELRDMWNYTEDGSLDKADVMVEVDGDGNVIKEVGDGKDASDKKDGDGPDGDGPDDGADRAKEGGADNAAAAQKAPAERRGSVEEEQARKRGYPVFLFSIEAPPPPSAKAD